MTQMPEITEENDFIVTMTDCRRAGHCPQGIRRWFEQQGFDFRHFLQHGISAKAMWDTGCGLGHQVVTRTWQHRQEAAGEPEQKA